MKEKERKNVAHLTAATVFGLILMMGCASIQIWPDYQRTAENRLVALQEKIGDGLKTGALTPDQSQSFLTKLKVIRTDYTAMKDKNVYRDEWDSLLGRIDALGEDINSALARTTNVRELRSDNRFVTLQKIIDDGRTSGHMTLAEERDFQARLDAIRRDYLRMTGGSSPPHARRDSRHFPPT